MAKKCQKENESVRISSNGVRNVSENVSTESCVPVLKGRKEYHIGHGHAPINIYGSTVHNSLN